MSASNHDEIEIPQVVNLSQVNVDHVHAELVRANQAAIRKLEAEQVDVSGIVIGTVVTGEFSGRRAAIGAMNAQQVEVREALVGGVRGASISMEGSAAMIAANSIQASEARAVIVAGAHIEAERINTGLLISRQVNGEVQTLVDARSAALAGILGGVVIGLIMLAGKLLFGRKK